MNKIEHAGSDLREMDALAMGTSVLHRLAPLCKLFVTVCYIAFVVSFGKYDLAELALMVLYPVLAFQIADIPIKTCFRKLRYVLPLVCAVGILNPFLDRTPMLTLGSLTVSGGVISMLTLMMKGVFSLMASFLLIATTPVDALCAALRKIRLPSMLTTLFLLTYRYVGVMIDEVGIMMQAYRLRAPGQRGVHISAWGSFLGQTLLRSMDRAQELYHSMLLRGFHGEFYYVGAPKGTAGGVICAFVCVGFFAAVRFAPLADLLGGLFVGVKV